MINDIRFCASSYLMFRSVVDDSKAFCGQRPPQLVNLAFPRRPVKSAEELLAALRCEVEEATKDGKAALALSGGIDSAILAKLMPKGSTAYTFKCVVPGVEVTDESKAAAAYATECGLKHEIIEIYWEDIEKSAPLLMKHKGAPIHSIENQIYKAALRAKEDGFTKLIFGENADIIYGGMDGLISKDWTFGDFVDRYSYVKPYQVLNDPILILEPFQEFTKNGITDAHAFINKYFRQEALGTYTNACQCGGIEFIGPYSKTVMDIPMDYQRVRSGDTKYLVREVFKMLYPNFEMAKKIPMPRPMNEWMKDWTGPTRPEFIPNCHREKSGDQKWMLYALETYLNMIDLESKSDE